MFYNAITSEKPIMLALSVKACTQRQSWIELNCQFEWCNCQFSSFQFCSALDTLRAEVNWTLPTRPSTPPSLPIWTLFLNITLQLVHCVHLTLIYCVCLVSVLVLVLEVFRSCPDHFLRPSLVPRLTPAPQIRRVSHRQYCALYKFIYLLTYLLGDKFSSV